MVASRVENDMDQQKKIENDTCVVVLVASEFMKRYIERCVYVVFALTVVGEVIDMDDSGSCKKVLAINASL